MVCLDGPATWQQDALHVGEALLPHPFKVLIQSWGCLAWYVYLPFKKILCDVPYLISTSDASRARGKLLGELVPQGPPPLYMNKYPLLPINNIFGKVNTNRHYENVITLSSDVDPGLITMSDVRQPTDMMMHFLVLNWEQTSSLLQFNKNSIKI